MTPIESALAVVCAFLVAGIIAQCVRCDRHVKALEERCVEALTNQHAQLRQIVIDKTHYALACSAVTAIARCNGISHHIPLRHVTGTKLPIGKTIGIVPGLTMDIDENSIPIGIELTAMEQEDVDLETGDGD